MRMMIPFAAFWLVFLPVEVCAEPLEQEVAAILDDAGAGTRWGLLVADANGNQLLAINPDGRFMPASNTKLFTTAAALWSMAQGDVPADFGGGATVQLIPAGHAAVPDVLLSGHGDASLSGAPDCIIDCLFMLADAVAGRTREVRNIVGDSTTFPDQRWSPGMSWNNMPTRSGTGISALSIDDNEIAAKVLPGALGEPPTVDLPDYYTVENHARTIVGTGEDIGYDRTPGSHILVLTGTIGIDSAPASLRLGVDDPAHYAAWQLAKMLRARGVRVTGDVMARHRALQPADDPAHRGAIPLIPVTDEPGLAKLTPPALLDDIALINKVSQNLHAELLLRRLGLIRGTGSIADGQAVVRTMLDQAGVPEHGVSLSDGSGMSSYNRVTPASMVRLLTWISKQSWGDQLRATLPVGGQDGSLSRRFGDTLLAGKIAAKTGTLNATNALAGYMTAKSGREFIFAIYANDVPDGVAATAVMDKALVHIAETN